MHAMPHRAVEDKPDSMLVEQTDHEESVDAHDAVHHKQRVLVRVDVASRPAGQLSQKDKHGRSNVRARPHEQRAGCPKNKTLVRTELSCFELGHPWIIISIRGEACYPNP